MADLFLLSKAQNAPDSGVIFAVARDSTSRGHHRIIGAVVFVIRNGLQRQIAPGNMVRAAVYNRFIRWSRLGVFNKIFAELARKGGKPGRIMIDATHLKAHRTAASLLKKVPPRHMAAPRAA